ncbi:MAG: hypothetical protein ACRESZ_00205 [Methylococcales bacterium]
MGNNAIGGRGMMGAQVDVSEAKHAPSPVVLIVAARAHGGGSYLGAPGITETEPVALQVREAQTVQPGVGGSFMHLFMPSVELETHARLPPGKLGTVTHCGPTVTVAATAGTIPDTNVKNMTVTSCPKPLPGDKLISGFLESLFSNIGKSS